MTLTNITKLINASLAGEMLSLAQQAMFIDKAIDDINVTLNTVFPTLSDLEADATEYTAIPDRYIRSVVVPGAAYYFYTMDEEGAPVADEYHRQYLQNVFYMQRDYLMLVPEEYQASTVQGTYGFEKEQETGTRGLVVDGYANYI